MVVAERNAVNIEAANRAIKFFANLKHHKGEWAGKPFILEPWQRDRIIIPLFGTLNPDGTRQYRTCYIELPRKNGKTTLAAGIAIYLLAMDGEMGAEVYSAANDREQASLVFNEGAEMVRQAPALDRRCRILDSQKRIIYYRTRSFYRAISAENYTKYGLNAHGIIYDELHASPNRELWDTLTTSTGSRRQPLIVVITTAGYDRNSICYEQHDYALKVLNGIVYDPTFLPVIYSAPEDADWKDEKVWFGCNPALNVFRSLKEMRTLAAKAKETPALEMTFRRLYLNQWTSSSERWLGMDKWDASGKAVDKKKLKGKVCYAGLDLSATTDLTALSLVFPDGDRFQILPHFWIPKDTMLKREHEDRVPYSLWVKQGYINATPGNVIDYAYIQKYLLDLLDAGYNIKELAFDRWGATKLIQDLVNTGRFTTEGDKEPRKIPIIPFGQGFASMSPPTKELENLVLSKKISHGRNPVLRWNVDNLVVNQDPAGNLKPDKAKSTSRIDGVVATIMALDRATRQPAPKKSVYDTRGIDSL